jgi:hypothetical protein
MGLRKSKPAEQPPPAVPVNGAGKDRVNDQDKAILDLKGRMRKIRTYQEKMNLQVEEVTTLIKTMMKDG